MQIQKQATNPPSWKLSIILDAYLSRFLVACCMFIFFNLLFRLADIDYGISSKMKNAFNFDFPGIEKLFLKRNIQTRREILLLGSSLFIYPIWKLDTRIGSQCADPNHYHIASYLSKSLNAGLSSDIQVNNWGVGGAMISDYYLLLQKYFYYSENIPEWVVIDCDPRAFYDSGVNAAKDTPIFDFFYNERDLFSYGKDYLLSFNSCLELLAGRYSSLYKNRQWFSKTIIGYAVNLIFVHTQPLSSSTGASNSSSSSPNKMQSSLEEYRARYFAISAKAIQPQLHFLELIADACREKHIKLLLINMPLTTLNKNLLDPIFYCEYKDSFKNITLRNSNAYFLDLSDSDRFKLSDFDDSVHLNADGAIKLQNKIADVIKANGI